MSYRNIPENSNKMKHYKALLSDIMKLKNEWISSQMQHSVKDPISLLEFKEMAQEAKALAKRYKAIVTPVQGIPGFASSESSMHTEDLDTEIKFIESLVGRSSKNGRLENIETLAEPLANAYGIAADIEVKKRIEISHFAILISLLASSMAFGYSNELVQTMAKAELLHKEFEAMQDISRKPNKELEARVNGLARETAKTHLKYMVQQGFASSAAATVAETVLSVCSPKKLEEMSKNLDQLDIDTLATEE